MGVQQQTLAAPHIRVARADRQVTGEIVYAVNILCQLQAAAARRRCLLQQLWRAPDSGSSRSSHHTHAATCATHGKSYPRKRRQRAHRDGAPAATTRRNARRQYAAEP